MNTNTAPAAAAAALAENAPGPDTRAWAARAADAPGFNDAHAALDGAARAAASRLGWPVVQALVGAFGLFVEDPA